MAREQRTNRERERERRKEIEASSLCPLAFPAVLSLFHPFFPPVPPSFTSSTLTSPPFSSLTPLHSLPDALALFPRSSSPPHSFCDSVKQVKCCRISPAARPGKYKTDSLLYKHTHTHAHAERVQRVSGRAHGLSLRQTTLNSVSVAFRRNKKTLPEPCNHISELVIEDLCFGVFVRVRVCECIIDAGMEYCRVNIKACCGKPWLTESYREANRCG